MIISEAEEKKIPGSDRKNPALATIKERFPLTKSGSTKHVYHISLNLKNTSLKFKVGDSIGIFPQNDPHHIKQLLEALHTTGEETIIDPRSNVPMSFLFFLSYKVNLARLTSSFLKLYCKHIQDNDKKKHLCHLLLPENKSELILFLNSHDMLDFVRAYEEVHVPLQDLCEQFSPLLPRFYSVASSPLSTPDEVHLTVALTVYTYRDQMRHGVTSHFLCHLAKENHTPIPIYVQPAHHFTLPQDGTIPMIMVGPGTGIAPFRAFLQERMHLGSTGKNWLFFGDRHRKSDYYYEEFLEELVLRDTLKLNVAFSRDQQHKKYVQHVMYENAQELFMWLQSGAHFYVCGDAQRMAKDVDAMLHMIIQEQGSMSAEHAKTYVKTMRTEKRYLTDVY